MHSGGIVHRDLNANNVLLSKSLQAKVADLGVSRFIPANLQYLTRGLSLAPGAIHYMSPEVLQENPSYGVKLDCFSFGHLSLYLAVEVRIIMHVRLCVCVSVLCKVKRWKFKTKLFF